MSVVFGGPSLGEIPKKRQKNTDEYPQGIGFMTNAKAYNGLAPEVRAAVDKAYAEAGLPPQ